MPVDPDRTPLAGRPAAGATALLVIDMISQWTFKDADRLASPALDAAPKIARLKDRCDRVGVPTIYVNDNQGRWRSDFWSLVAMARETGPGAVMDAYLLPRKKDFAVLKVKHSGFHETPLDLLLRHLRVKDVILTGIATEHCIVATALGAVMRDYRVVVPRDCVASQTESANRRALDYLRESLNIRTGPSNTLRLPMLF